MIRQIYGNSFPLNGQEISFIATLIAILVYVVVSLLTCREDFNMDRMLHRGVYADARSTIDGQIKQVSMRKLSWFEKAIEFDDNFTTHDKLLVAGLSSWGLFWFAMFLIITAWNFWAPWPNSVWLNYWHVTAIGIPVILAVVTGIWFAWGGLRDMKSLFTQLNLNKTNPLDDGTVIGHQNLDEIALADSSSVIHRKDAAESADRIMKRSA